MSVSSEAATKQDLADAVRQLSEMSSQNLADAVRQLSEMSSQNLADAVRQINHEIAETREEFSRDLAETHEKVTEQIRDSQTELLRAFNEWARPVDVRLRHADELVQRMGWLEERVSKLERGDRPSTH
ncbi:MAG: hypothetical protein ABSF12_10525 [Bryobacteraceae bacterium]